MGEVVAFRRLPALLKPAIPHGFSVHVLKTADGWLVVSRQHSWLFLTRREAQAEARAIADGFGVSVITRIGGAA
jgi:hypothetical protein